MGAVGILVGIEDGLAVGCRDGLEVGHFEGTRVVGLNVGATIFTLSRGVHTLFTPFLSTGVVV